MRSLAALVAAMAPLACTLPVTAVRPEPVLVSDGRYTMGTLFEVTLIHRDEEVARATLVEIFAEVERLDALLSIWDPESDITRLNRTAGHGPQRVRADVTRIVADSLAYSRLTRGSFDVTVGPLVRLWQRAAERDVPPSDEELSAARALVGFEQVAVGEDGRVALRREGVSLDLGGLAKGWALDQILPLLRERGIEGALLNFGQSSTWAFGAPAGKSGWRLLVRGPDDDFLGLVTLRDQALSISGSLGQWVEIRGRLYGHVFDPRSGRPLTRRRQALVVAPTAALAEALSKALLILGGVEGIELIASQADCAGFLIEVGGRTWTTRNWTDAVSFEVLDPAGGSPGRVPDPGTQALPR